MVTKTTANKHNAMPSAKAAVQQVTKEVALSNEVLLLQDQAGNMAVDQLLQQHSKNAPSFREEKPNLHNLPPSTRTVLNNDGQPLDPIIRAEMESRFGHDFGQVRVHTNANSARSARLLNAQAYTIGQDIVFGKDRYVPQSGAGKLLLAHELAHVIQQTSGGSPPPLHTNATHEQEAETAAQTAVSSQTAPITITQSTGIGIARSVDDWLQGSLDVTRLTYSEVVKDIDEIQQWLGRQISSTPESAHLEEALQLLTVEKRRKEKRARAQKRKKKRRQKADAVSELQPPRILRERTSVQYQSDEEVNQEIDLIMDWLANKRLSRQDRQLLQTELNNLAPQFNQGRNEALQQRQANRLQRVLVGSGPVDETKALVQVASVLQNLSPDPQLPDVFLIIHEGEQVRISAAQVNKLRKEITAHFRKGSSRVQGRIRDGFGRYDAQAEVNREHPVISRIAGFLGDAGDPILDMTIRHGRAKALLQLTNKMVAAGDFPAAAKHLAKAEELGTQIYKAGLAFNESHIEGAQLAVTGLEFTRDVSFAISGSIAAIVAAPVVAAGVAGAGVTGVAATGATALGTGAVVGTGSAIVGGSAAGAGELLAGNSLEKAGEAFRKEGVRRGREGIVAGVTGGIGLKLGQALKVGTGASKQLGRRVLAEGTADFVGGTTDSLLQGKDLDDSLKDGGTNALFALPGSVVGSVVKSPGRRAVAETVTSGASAFGLSIANDKSIEDSLVAGGSAIISSATVGRAKASPHPRAEAAATALGQRVQRGAKRVKKTARDLTAAAMIGTADVLNPANPQEGHMPPQPAKIAQVDASPRATQPSKTGSASIPVKKKPGTGARKQTNKAASRRRSPLQEPGASDDIDRIIKGLDSETGGFEVSGPGVRIPLRKRPRKSVSGKLIDAHEPTQILEVGAGKKRTPPGVPIQKGLTHLTRSDYRGRGAAAISARGLVHLDATKPVPPAFAGQFDSIIINNPRGYVPNIAELGRALRPGGRIVIQGRGRIGAPSKRNRRGFNPDFQALLDNPPPPGFRRIETRREGALPADRSNTSQDILGGPFFKTAGDKRIHPNARIIFEKQPDASHLDE